METTTLLENQPTTSLPTSEERAMLCARTAEDNKAQNIVVLDLRRLTPLYDFFVIATGTSRRQMHAISDEIEAAMRAVGDKRQSMQGYQGSRWIVEDFGDVMIHVFDAEAREYYALDDLWADAVKVEWK
ncbi:MAG: ribosome silencing factor [Planctomycetota bacterium]